MRTSTAARTGQYAALLGYLVFLAFPFLWLISIAFKPPRELAILHPAGIPEDPTLDNFRQAFDEQPLPRAGLNSLLAALGAALIAVLIATPMATGGGREPGARPVPALTAAAENGLPAWARPPSVASVAAFNAIFNSGLGRGCTYSIRMRRGPGALTGPGSPRR
ncbi:hypothetical protein SVIOM342S_06615 [Streptomyces violaceorubidus]